MIPRGDGIDIYKIMIIVIIIRLSHVPMLRGRHMCGRDARRKGAIGGHAHS
jgi:hypothetical protein